MKVAVIQSSYIPWRGYFDMIDDVDLFVFYEDVQYSKGSWRNRNKIKTDRGTTWLTVSVDYAFPQKICDTRINYSNNWNRQHVDLLRQWYKSAPFFSDYFDEFASLIEPGYQSISELNQVLCSWLMRQLFIDTKLMSSTGLECEGQKTERLIDLLKKVGATHYLSGPSAMDYIETDQFISNGIGLAYKSYDYADYPQLHGKFEGAVSVLDLLFNTGPNARKFLKSFSSDKVVVEI
jgi:hypothetical protein